MDEHERELRRLRLEAREQQRDVEAAEAELAASQTRLTALLCDWAAQGRHLHIDAVDRRRHGRVVHVGDSVITIATDTAGRELIVLGQIDGFVVSGMGELAVTRGEPTMTELTAGHPRSLIAHLRALVGEAAMVTIERRATDPVRGRLVGATDTHTVVRLGSGGEAVIPLDAIVSVSTQD